MRVKVVKLVPNEFLNESRDLRELSVLSSLNCDITVIAKESTTSNNYGYNVIRLGTRPVYRWIKNLNINRIASIFVWAKCVRVQRADIISCHDIDALLIGWLSNYFKLKKSYLVYDSHEFEYARNDGRNTIQLFIIKHLERFLMKRCAFSMMVNDSIAEEVVKLHHLKTRPVVVRNIPYYWNLDEQLLFERKVSFKNDYHIPNEAKIVLYQGGLMKRRGIENAIKAVSKLDNVYLLILGNGQKQYIDYLRKLVIELQLGNHVIFHPAAPYSDLWKYTGIADIGLCVLENVCKNHYYALPNKFSEYVQALVPIVSNDFPELKRIIDKYSIGSYCNADNPEELAVTLKTIIDSPEILNNYRANLRKAKSDLCWEKESTILYDAYNNLITKIND